MLRGPHALTALVALVVAVVAAGCPKVAADAPAACRAAVQCYFGNDPDHQLGTVLRGLGTPFGNEHAVDIYVATYGQGGSCWADREDTALMHSCEDRCRALLWTDCSQGYIFPTAPFCSDTKVAEPGGDRGRGADGTVLPCQFAMECRRDVSGGATACPDPLDSCTAPTPDAGQLDRFGCCDIDQGFPDGGCAYAHVDDNDHRAPAGNPKGTLDGGP
ncbi:MAG TPA: hypothetical protein VGO62_07140 [Myxococcota bacterium]